MIHVTSLIIGNSLVNEFEKRKTNADIEYNFGIQLVSHSSFFLREEKKIVKKKHSI